MGNRSKIHSFTYTPDAAKATALLGNTPGAYNQVWHLPTSDEKFTGDDWIKLFADTMQVKAKAMTIPKFMIRVMGIFNPLMKEMVEMLYQNEEDYFFDSSKFEKRFGVSATTPKQGVKIMMDHLKSLKVVLVLRPAERLIFVNGFDEMSFVNILIDAPAKS